MNLSIRILLGLGLGLLLGIVVSQSQNLLLTSITQYVEPIGVLWINAIRMTVIPLLMALLITAIAGQNSTGVVAQLGGKSLAVFILMILASCIFTLLLAPGLLSFVTIEPQASQLLLKENEVDVTTVLPPIRDWLVGLIPSNPFKAANDNAILPLLVFTGLFAAALQSIKVEQKKTIIEFFEAIKSAMFVLIRWIMLIAPIGIFAIVFPLTVVLGVSAITSLGSFILIVCGLITIMILLLYPLACIVGKLPLIVFIKAVAPVQAIGFSTRSSLASLPATIAATESLGISSKISGMVLPLAVTLFKFASPIARTTGTYFIANLYGINLTIIELSMIAMVIGLLSFYSPGIPSGGLLIMAPVYTMLNLPVAGIGLLIAVDLIVDMFITAANVTANVTVAAILSRSERTIQNTAQNTKEVIES
jgi:Na+/H+-dicarboxylate symporter